MMGLREFQQQVAQTLTIARMPCCIQIARSTLIVSTHLVAMIVTVTVVMEELQKMGVLILMSA